MRFGNPAIRTCARRVDRGEMAVEAAPATYKGIAVKSVVFAAITILAAIGMVALFNHALAIESDRLLSAVLIGATVSFIPMLICSLVIAFVPKTAGVLGTIYCICQGALLGLAVYLVDVFMPGIAMAALLGTVIVFVVSVVANKFLGVRIKGGFMRVLMVALFSLFAVEIIMFIVSMLTGGSESVYQINFWLQLAITALLVVYASVVLMWDLQMTDMLVQAGADKKYEWYISFSLITALVYLYVEILELLIRLAAIFGRSRN